MAEAPSLLMMRGSARKTGSYLFLVAVESDDTRLDVKAEKSKKTDTKKGKRKPSGRYVHLGFFEFTQTREEFETELILKCGGRPLTIKVRVPGTGRVVGLGIGISYPGQDDPAVERDLFAEGLFTGSEPDEAEIVTPGGPIAADFVFPIDDYWCAGFTALPARTACTLTVFSNGRVTMSTGRDFTTGD